MRWVYGADAGMRQFRPRCRPTGKPGDSKPTPGLLSDGFSDRHQGGRHWQGRVQPGQRSAAGRPISQFDAQIAAIARYASVKLATRNVDDFQNCGVSVVNPWTASSG